MALPKLQPRFPGEVGRGFNHPGKGTMVSVVATSINPVDWQLRRGDLKSMMPLEMPAILGRDVAGLARSG